MTTKNLHESLFILHKCYEVLKTQREELTRKIEEKKKLGRVEQLAANYIILEARSFLDEFHDNFKVGEDEQFKERIHAVKNMAKPILKRINKWPHLGKFRNNIIAHPWREGKEFVVPDMNKYKVPRNWFEYIMLVDLIRYIYEIIVFEFKAEFRESQLYMQLFCRQPKKEVTTET